MPTLPPPPKASSKKLQAGSTQTVSIPEFETGPGEFVPPIIFFHAVGGFGKTTIGAFAPKPLMLMTKMEKGYKTLLGRNLVPDITRATVDEWDQLLAILQSLYNDPQGFETIVLDSAVRFSEMCMSKVCERDYNGRMDEKRGGFMFYKGGYTTMQREWTAMLCLIERVRDKHGTMFLVLSHSHSQTMKPPGEEDFVKWVPNIHPLLCETTYDFADVTLFGNHPTIIDEDLGQKKAIGGTERVIYTSSCDKYLAKHRHGLKPEIKLTNKPSESWNIIYSAIKGVK